MLQNDSLRNNEDVHSVLLETNRKLEETVAEIGHQLEEGKERLEQATRKTKSLLSVTRMFLEFGDQNRATFLAFLERDYDMKVDRRIFKQQLTYLIDALPSEKINDLHGTMETVLMYIELGPLWATTARGRKFSLSQQDEA
jgi:hypothetical protein